LSFVGGGAAGGEGGGEGDAEDTTPDAATAVQSVSRLQLALMTGAFMAVTQLVRRL